MTARDIWTERDSIVLEAIAEHNIDHGKVRDPKTLNELPAVATLGLDSNQVTESVERLYQGDLVRGMREPMLSGVIRWGMMQPTERGRRTVGQWPSQDIATALISAIEQRATEAESSKEQSLWNRVAEDLRSIGSGSVTAVVTEALKRSVGL